MSARKGRVFRQAALSSSGNRSLESFMPTSSNFSSTILSISSRDFVRKLLRGEQRFRARLRELTAPNIGNHAHVLPDGLSFAAGPVISKPLKKNGTGIGAKRAENQTQYRAFTAPGLAHDHQTLLRLHAERKAVEDLFSSNCMHTSRNSTMCVGVVMLDKMWCR